MQREGVDHVGGVVGCRIHRRHAGRVFGGDRLGHGVEEHGKNVLREQAGEELLGGLLVDVVDVGGAEFLGFFVGLGGVGRLKLDAGGESGLGDALFFFERKARRRRRSAGCQYR